MEKATTPLEILEMVVENPGKQVVVDAPDADYLIHPIDAVIDGDHIIVRFE